MSAILLLAALSAPADQPLIRWVLDESRIRDGKLMAVAGPNPDLSGFPARVQSPWGPAMSVNGEWHTVTLDWEFRRTWPEDPKDDFSATVAFRTTEARAKNRIAGCLHQMEGRYEGWELKMEEGRLAFVVHSGEGIAKVLSRQPLGGKWTWATASYTGGRIRLVVGGELQGEAPCAFGPLEYTGRAPLAVSGYWDGLGSTQFEGDVRELRIDKPALSDAAARALHTSPPAVPPVVEPAEPEEFALTIAPYLQNPAFDGMTIMWETTRTATTEVWHGPAPDQMVKAEGPKGRLHRVRLEGLPAGAPRYYRTASVDSQGRRIETPINAFRPLPRPGETVRFAVTADTQTNGEETKKTLGAIFEQRPDFLLVVGDLVSTGWNRSHWHAFFSNGQPGFGSMPLVPVVGNHERNAGLYYAYTEVESDQEHRHTLRSGPVEIFSTDTDQYTQPGSEQHAWLDRALGASQAPWKLGAHHYPVWTSDYYGPDEDTPFGDSNAREFVPLYEKHGVRAVFSGHVHNYERTFPMRGSQVVEDGITYFVLGGGGGGLDRNNAPFRPWFSRNRRNVHHYALVTATDREMLIQVYDWNNLLIDSLELRR